LCGNVVTIAYSKNRTPVLEPSAVWKEIIHFAKVQIKSIDKCVIIIHNKTVCLKNTTPIFF